MARARFGGVVSAAALLALVVAAGAAGYSALLRSTSGFEASAGEILGIDRVQEPVAAELGRSTAAALPGDLSRSATISEVAEAMVRSDDFEIEFRRAASEAHELWLDGGEPLLTFAPRAVTPIARAALRDVDLDLSRQLGDSAVVSPDPVVLPMAAGASLLEALGVGAALFALAALALLALELSASRDLAADLKRAAKAAALAASLLGLLTLLTPLPLLRQLAPAVSTPWVMLAELRTPIAVVVLVVLAVAGTLHASAERIAENRAIRAHLRAAKRSREPAAETGALRRRWWRKVATDEGVGVFFEGGTEGEDATADGTRSPGAEKAPDEPQPTTSPLKTYLPR